MPLKFSSRRFQVTVVQLQVERSFHLLAAPVPRSGPEFRDRASRFSQAPWDGPPLESAASVSVARLRGPTFVSAARLSVAVVGRTSAAVSRLRAAALGRTSAAAARLRAAPVGRGRTSATASTAARLRSDAHSRTFDAALHLRRHAQQHTTLCRSARPHLRHRCTTPRCRALPHLRQGRCAGSRGAQAAGDVEEVRGERLGHFLVRVDGVAKQPRLAVKGEARPPHHGVKVHESQPRGRVPRNLHRDVVEELGGAGVAARPRRSPRVHGGARVLDPEDLLQPGGDHRPEELSLLFSWELGERRGLFGPEHVPEHALVQDQSGRSNLSREHFDSFGNSGLGVDEGILRTAGP